MSIVSKGTDLVAMKMTTITRVLNFYRKELTKVAYAMVTDQGCIDDGVVYYIVDGKDYTQLPANLAPDTPYIVKVNGVDQWSPFTRELCDTLIRIVDPNNEVFTTVTIHVFHAVGAGVSFPEHIDPTEVLLYMLEGEDNKRFTIEDKEYDFVDQPYLQLPAYVPHRGINDGSNLMLSIGFEHYLQNRKVADVC